MLSSYWKSKSDGYELVDGSASGSNSSLQSSPTHEYYQCESTRSSKQHHHKLSSSSISSSLSSSSTSLTSSTICFIRRNRRKLTLLFFTILAIYTIESILGVILSPPAYVVLEPDNYEQTLRATVRDRLPLQSLDIRQALLTNLQQLSHPFSSLSYSSPSANKTQSPPSSTVPNNLFSSDKHAPPSNWAPMWKAKGFEPHFYNDEEANAWVEKVWKDTDIVTAWRMMPRSILRADMLRYLLLLIEGGTWSDMDTIPVMHLSNWTTETIPFHKDYSDRLQQSSSPAASIRRYMDGQSNKATVDTPPIRAILSLECVPTWVSLRGALELLRLKPLNRHRNLQFVQWTVHMGPHHPIMVDVLRRILDTMDLYRAYTLEENRENRRVGWGWKESPSRPVISSLVGKEETTSFASPAPWESIGQQWVYTKGHWRLGWHPTSVEEWTGPGVWTDAVVSYIYATTGLRPEQLAKIKKPTQVGDLIILPEHGFNPPKGSASNPYSVSRVVHLFRGSWKQKYDTTHNVTKQ